MRARNCAGCLNLTMNHFIASNSEFLPLWLLKLCLGYISAMGKFSKASECMHCACVYAHTHTPLRNYPQGCSPLPQETGLTGRSHPHSITIPQHPDPQCQCGGQQLLVKSFQQVLTLPVMVNCVRQVGRATVPRHVVIQHHGCFWKGGFIRY